MTQEVVKPELPWQVREGGRRREWCLKDHRQDPAEGSSLGTLELLPKGGSWGVLVYHRGGCLGWTGTNIAGAFPSFSSRCSGAVVKSLLFRFLPFLKWLPRYPVKDWLIGDITSGFSVGIMHLPQGLAYALLAGLPPVNGLYSSFYPVFLYFFFGTSRHNSVGPFAVISVMIGSVTDLMVPSDDFMELVNGTNNTILNEARRDAVRVELVAALTILVGIFQVGLGLLQFGFVVTYLSDPLVRGYTTAASVHVLISQLKYVFGVRLGEHSGPLSLFTVSRAGHGQFGAAGAGTAARPDQLRECPFPALYFSLCCRLKAPVAPRVDYFARMVGNAFAIAIVGYAICISLGKIFALKHGYKVDSNQELIALGMCNFLGGFFQCFSISCSMSRSLVQESTGGNSQLIWVMTFVATLLLNLDIGLGVSVAFSLLTVIFRTQM
uniref:Solute carrier family 26 member 6 n=1 Tax=Crocodylus porosus TaxID=8502 RepID=A0A7M4FJU2_CROPO